MKRLYKYLLPHGLVRYAEKQEDARRLKGRLPQDWSGAAFECDPDYGSFESHLHTKVECVTREGQTRVAQRVQPGRRLTLKKTTFASSYLHLGIAPTSARPLPHHVRIFLSGVEVAFLQGPINEDRWTFVRIALPSNGDPIEFQFQFDQAHDLYVSNPIMGSSRQKKQKNVIVLIADSLQPIHLGYHRVPRGEESITPYIDRFFANGRIYRNAFSQGEWTLSSLASMATGLYAVQHGVYNPGEHQRRLPGSIPTMAESLNRSGYKTFGYSTGRRFLPPLGHFRGYDQFYYGDWHRPYMGEQVVARACEFIEVHQNEPLFCFMHFYDPHPPFGRFSYYSDVHSDPSRWAAPENLYKAWKHNWKHNKTGDQALLNRLRKAGEVKIKQLDFCLSRLFEQLLITGLLDQTMVILTADHGRMYTKSKQPLLQTELTHVPLLVFDPSSMGQEFIERYTEPGVDLYPTAMDCASLPHPEHLAGHSLLDRTNEENSIARSESLFRGDYELVLRNDRWCYAFHSTMDSQTGVVDCNGNVVESLYPRDGGEGSECYSTNLIKQEEAAVQAFRQIAIEHIQREKYHTDREYIEW